MIPLLLLLGFVIIKIVDLRIFSWHVYYDRVQAGWEGNDFIGFRVYWSWIE